MNFNLPQESLLHTTANVGEGLFFAGQSHVAMRVLGAPFEHELITSNPEEVLEQQKKEKIMHQDASFGQSSQNPNQAPKPKPQFDTQGSSVADPMDALDQAAGATPATAEPEAQAAQQPTPQAQEPAPIQFPNERST